MARHDMTHTIPAPAARHVPVTSLERLLAFAREWRTRRDMKRGLGRLSNFHLRDIGLTKADVEAACADSFDRSAARALKNAVQNRAGNW